MNTNKDQNLKDSAPDIIKISPKIEFFSFEDKENEMVQMKMFIKCPLFPDGQYCKFSEFLIEDEQHGIKLQEDKDTIPFYKHLDWLIFENEQKPLIYAKLKEAFNAYLTKQAIKYNNASYDIVISKFDELYNSNKVKVKIDLKHLNNLKVDESQSSALSYTASLKAQIYIDEKFACSCSSEVIKQPSEDNKKDPNYNVKLDVNLLKLINKTMGEIVVQNKSEPLANNQKIIDTIFPIIEHEIIVNLKNYLKYLIENGYY